MAVDPSYGSSNFAIVASQLVNGKIQVIAAEEYQRPNFTDMIERIWTCHKSILRCCKSGGMAGFEKRVWREP
jgi:hypothetical protein